MESNSKPPAAIRILHAIEDTVLVLVFALMVSLAFSQILLRNFAGVGIYWSDELQRHLVLWIALLGAMSATRMDHHISIDVLTHFLTPRAKAAVRIVTDLFTATVCTILAVNAVRLILMQMEYGQKAFAEVPAWVMLLIMPVGFGIMALRYLVYLVRHARMAVTGEGLPEEAAEDEFMSGSGRGADGPRGEGR